MTKQKNKPGKNESLPIANTGNASNPSPQEGKMDNVNNQQLLNKQAEKYLRESGNIEDMPDAEDQEKTDE